jgi:hypothetical protein
MRHGWRFVASALVLSAACDKDSDAVQRAQRKELCPDLDTWAACSARLTAEQERANAVSATAASAAQAERDRALAAKYGAMTGAQRQTALEKCFGPSADTRCEDSQKNAIIAAATNSAEQAALKQISQSIRIKRGGITTANGVMLFKEPDGPKQAAGCMKKYQLGNPEAEDEAHAFTSPMTDTIDQLRGLCLIATGEVLVTEGTRVDVVARKGAVVQVRVLDGNSKGSVLYAMNDAVTQ